MKKPNIARFLAAQAIRKAFTENSLPTCLEELKTLCASETHPRLLSAYLRWQRELINRILVYALLDDLSEIERDFVYYRYRNRRSMKWISMHIPVSERQLYFLNDRILLRLETLLFYQPTCADAFSPKVILNLLRVIDARIAVFSLRVDLPVDIGWLDHLFLARYRCHALFDLMMSFLSPHKETLAQKIIRQKFHAPNATAEELLRQLDIPSSEREKSIVQGILRDYLGCAEKCLCIEKIPESEKFAVF